MFSKFDLRPWLPALLVILCLANIGFLLFITIVFYPIYIHSDAAAAPLLAEEIIRSGQLFPDGWYFVNSDVWIINRHLLILPFVWLLGQGYAAYLAMQATFIALLAAAAVYALRPFLHRPLHIFVAVSFLAVPFSRHFLFHIYGEIAYGPILLVMILLVGLIARAAKADTLLNWHILALFVLSFLVAASSPPRFAGYLLLPTIVMFILMFGARQRWISVLGAMVIATVLARVWNAELLSDLYRSARGSSYALVPFNELHEEL